MTENLQIDLETKPVKRSFINRPWWPFLAMILFAAVYFVAYQMIAPESTDISNLKILGIFDKYAQYFGFGLAFLSLLLWYVLYGLKSLLRLGKFRLVNSITYLLGLLPWGIFSYQMVFKEPRYTDIARAVIDHVAQPLWYTVLVLAGIGGLWFVLALFYSLFKKNK